MVKIFYICECILVYEKESVCNYELFFFYRINVYKNNDEIICEKILFDLF